MDTYLHMYLTTYVPDDLSFNYYWPVTLNAPQWSYRHLNHSPVKLLFLVLEKYNNLRHNKLMWYQRNFRRLKLCCLNCKAIRFIVILVGNGGFCHNLIQVASGICCYHDCMQIVGRWRDGSDSFSPSIYYRPTITRISNRWYDTFMQKFNCNSITDSYFQHLL